MDQYKATKQHVRVPAEILSWPIGYTSRKVYVALLVFQLRAQCYQSRRILKTYEEIAALCGGINVKTVAAAVRELAEGGYIQVKENMYWSEDGKKLFRGTNEYTILPMAVMDDAYIWLPVKLLAARISPAAFSVCLFLLRKQGQNNRSWPSLRRGFQTICQKNGKAMPRKTICDAIQQLRHCLMVIVIYCKKINKARSMNTYMLTVFGDWSACTAKNEATPSVVPDVRGGYFFGGLPVKNKITQRAMYRKRKKVFLISALCLKFRSALKFFKNTLFSRPCHADTG